MELGESRKRLNQIDSELLELFERRMEVVSHVADYKEERGLPVRDAAREREILFAVADRVEEPMIPYATRFMETLLELSCDYQQRRREETSHS